MKLSEAELKKVLVIKKFDQSKLGLEFMNLLFDTGLLPNTKIQLLAKNLLQDKIIIQIGEVVLALRLESANSIEVEYE